MILNPLINPQKGNYIVLTKIIEEQYLNAYLIKYIFFKNLMT